MDTLNKLAAPATAKIRQLQKMVQDIKKNDGSLLNKIKRLKNKPRPNVPVRDYRDSRENDHCSDPEYNNPCDDLSDDNYEPPPPHREFTRSPFTSLPRGEYLESCHARPSRPPRKPLRPVKPSKQLPPEPLHQGSDKEEDYIDPDPNFEDDYIEPTENSSPNFVHHLQNSVLLYQNPALEPAERGNAAAENGSTDQDKDADVYNKPWFASACDRKTADDALLRSNKDGAFMVRKSSGQDVRQPYTLVVFYNGRVYNIPIRFMPSTRQYALGREKKGEEYFSSVSHIIENHQRNLLVLIDSQSNSKDATKLYYPVKP
ncbi:hypothetical protein XENORESO_018969 [Xenotaenia resolanae]|uniref:SH2 domain-containing protein n=1 Tax=Xenotaenia resolanae TaxID=208358 RepID=A0ABV0X6L3_9TELE